MKILNCKIEDIEMIRNKLKNYIYVSTKNINFRYSLESGQIAFYDLKDK